MKILGIIYLIIFLIMFVFGKVKINGSTNITIFQRVGLCAIGSLLLTAFVGLPVLGIVFLLGL